MLASPGAMEASSLPLAAGSALDALADDRPPPPSSCPPLTSAPRQPPHRGNGTRPAHGQGRRPPAGPATFTERPRAPAWRELGPALLGLLTLGGAAALGSPSPLAALRLLPSVLLVQLAALALTAPALVALHQFAGLAATPEALAAALGRALVDAGRVAAGLAAVVLFFAATTELSLVLLVLSLAGVGLFASVTACVELARAERSAQMAREPAAQTQGLAPRFGLLVLGWVALTWIIAVRVGADVSLWVLGR